MSAFAQATANYQSFQWEDLLGLLRDELQEYGSLLGLLSAQQQNILDRRPEALLEINQTVQTQMEASQMLQNRRQGFVETLAGSMGASKDSSLSDLIPHFPDVTQPMFQSLVEEINNLISKIRSKIEQNQRLLSRLSEVTEQILSIADPASHSKTYSRSGSVYNISSDRPSINESA
jgi:flagellar biosynthesis/type III secretory pathway chaperone